MTYPTLTLATPPASEPLTLTDAKLYLRIDSDDEDDLVSSLIRAVRAVAEEYLRKSLITQSWKLKLDGGLPETLLLARGPIQSVVSVQTVTDSGVAATVNPALYTLDADRGLITFHGSATADHIVVNYTAGYGDAEDVPAGIRQGMLMHLAALYDVREGGGGLAPDTVALYAPYREHRL